MDSKDSDFILWVIIQYYFIILLKFSQVWPLRTLLVGSHNMLKYSHRYCCCLRTGTTRLLHVSYSRLRTHHWSKRALSPSTGSWDWKQKCGQGTYLLQLGVIHLGLQLTDIRNMCVYSNLCVVGWKLSLPPKIKISTLSLWNLWMYIIWKMKFAVVIKFLAMWR